MAHFYGELGGGGRLSTRTGTKSNGLRGHIRGWNVGALVEVWNWSGKDRVDIALTGGSNDSSRTPLLSISEGERVESIREVVRGDGGRDVVIRVRAAGERREVA